MDRTMRVTAWSVLIVATMAVLLTIGAAAGEAKTTSVRLTPIQNSDVSGTAIFHNAGGGVEVGMSVRGLPEAGVKHINHVHGGATCEDERAGRGAPATIPLTTLTADENGNGEATTALEDITVEQLFDTAKERYVLVHTEAKKGEGIPPGIACADLDFASSMNGTVRPEAAGREHASAKAVPDTGGPRPADIFLPLAAVLAVLGLAVVRWVAGRA
jgi:Cu/Zn superoxide dismutase